MTLSGWTDVTAIAAVDPSQWTFGGTRGTNGPTPITGEANTVQW